MNANLVWPGTASFAEWLLENRKLVEGKKVLEIGRYGDLLEAIKLDTKLADQVSVQY